MEENNLTQAPVFPVTKPKPSFKQSFSSNKIPLLAVFVVLMMGLSSVATYFILKSPAPVQTSAPVVQTSPTAIVQPTSTPDPTANWKTYNDTTYKFTLKLPQDWNVITTSVEPKPKDIYVAYDSDTVDAYIERNPAKMNQSDLSRIIINSIPVIRIKNNIDTYRREYAVLPITNGTLILEATLSLDSSEAVIFDQILSTFKFLDSAR